MTDNKRRRPPQQHQKRDGQKNRKKKIPAQLICPYCKTGRLKKKGPVDTVGTVASKCTKCGKRVRKRREAKVPEELTFATYRV